jgi:nitrile hydratase
MNAARFPVGARVRVRAAHPPGHVRTPWFVRGKAGEVLGLAAHDPNPEDMAYGRRDRPPVPVYRVRFGQRTLWPDYAGPAADSCVVDLFEHWLEPAS